MAQIIPFPNRRRMTLQEAYRFLGRVWFRRALQCPLDELERDAHHPQAMLSGADEAYGAVLRFRTPKTSTAPPAPVIRIAA